MSPRISRCGGRTGRASWTRERAAGRCRAAEARGMWVKIGKDGRLTVAVADGGELVVPPDEHCEACTVTGSLPPVRRGFSLTALPGGGLARS